MNKRFLWICIIAAVLTLSGCHRMDIRDIASGQIVVLDGTEEYSQTLTEGDLTLLKAILHNKPKEEVPGCAFYKNWYIQLGDAELHLADDGCTSIWLANEGCAIILSQDAFASLMQLLENYSFIPL